MSVFPPSVAVPDLAGVPVGAVLAATLESVDEGVLRGLGDSPLVDVIIAAERQIAHLQAMQLRAMAELSVRENYAFCGGCGDADENSIGHEHNPVRAVGSELSAALSWTPAQADSRAGLAIELVEELPDTIAALDEGRIDVRRAGLIADKTRVLGPMTRGAVERAVLPTAGEQTSTQLGRALDRRVMAADPAAAGRRRERGRRDRRVERPRPSGNADGIADMVLTGPAEDLTALWTAVDAAARAARTARRDGTTGGDTHGDARTLDQHRFDILTGLGWTALTLGHLGCCTPTCVTPDTSQSTATATVTAAAGVGSVTATAAVRVPRLGTRHGRPAAVQVTVALTTLAGADHEPADLDGYGPIPAHAARTIAADATLRRLLTDPRDGRLLEYGRTTYTPPQALKDFVIARDRTCRFPTVTTPARSCDIDHRIPYHHGGTTGITNTQALSRRAHLDKTFHGWELDQPSPGTYRWTSPARRTYRTPPEAVGPVHTNPTNHPAPPKPATNPDPPEQPPF